ncbi:hypothetical protein KC316_g9298 [Hortaea werneckii]|nr:hypothetical protein KC324_g9470 [Hortaea werneckii]KAI7579769.1 hypothetical protein KC316_g9298 [Hortaea werneckii]
MSGNGPTGGHARTDQQDPLRAAQVPFSQPQVQVFQWYYHVFDIPQGPRMRSPYAQTNLMPLSPHVQQVPSVPPPSFRYHLPDLALGPPPRMIAAGIPSYMGAPHHHRADNVNTPHLDASMCAPCQYPRNDVHGYSGGAMGLAPCNAAPVVPFNPRGPPRKPRQSGYAIWVGNLPPSASIADLKDYFSRGATRDIESLFLMSRSNCAFVNYHTEAACVAAMNRFHNSCFEERRLVCRLRRGAAASDASATAAENLASLSVSVDTGAAATDSESPEPLIVGDTKAAATARAAMGTAEPPAGNSSPQTPREKFFVLKSLTTQDLEASVRSGTWATQVHIEQALNKAYDEMENVILIFSANKSGEYFGYARMASKPFDKLVDLKTTSAGTEHVQDLGSPRSIPTPPTATAPKGHIIDDSARGTIFWEAEHSGDEAKSVTKEDGGDGQGPGQGQSRQFRIEWRSTARLPFYRTCGLRNPFNANREVKIARDGTEIEPSVGAKLVQMFHRLVTY